MARRYGLLISALLLGLAASTAAYCEAVSAQVDSGRELYIQTCAECHGAMLGGGKGPALHGATFLQNWQHKTARQLYSRILTTMPASSPGSLDPKEVLDLTIYLLSQNGVAIGAQAKTSPDLLNHLTIVVP